ncbi:hypothetical protein [Erwinia aphidicola]|uniref:hypothetical protein n=1 Tax=Erwinia aphidicola TaxID=68334 RepID=UPI003016E2D3
MYKCNYFIRFLQNKSNGYVIFYLSFLILSGCVSSGENKRALHPHQEIVPYMEPKIVKKEADTDMTQQSVKANLQQEMLDRCEKELDALKTVSPENYRSRMTAFSELMAAANQYATIRNEMDERTTSTVDALYQYRTSRICAGISWILLKALSENGEGHR